MRGRTLTKALLLHAAAMMAALAPAPGLAQAAASTQLERPRVPLGPVLVILQGKGDQVYRCQITAGVAAWLLDRPDATLLDAHGDTVGSHGAGPAWHYKDGSSVRGELLEKMPAQAPQSVPWLLLRASAHEGTGLLTQVETIERTDTHGGLAPATGCDAAHIRAEVRVPYTATYTFRGKS